MTRSLALHITMTEARFRELLKEAYIDGFQDGAVMADIDSVNEEVEDKAWADSVALDRAEEAIARVKAGGRV